METQALVILLIVISLCYVPSIWRTFVYNRKLKSIPTVGPSGILTSYLGALRLFFHGREMLQEGYSKFHGSFFKVPTLTTWIIVGSGRNLNEEICRAPEDALSSNEALRAALFTDLTVGPAHFDDTFRTEVVKRALTRNISAKFPDVQDEIAAAYEDYIPTKDDGWTEVTVYSTTMNIVCRATNRMFIGLPLCRNPEWMKLNERLAFDLIKATIIHTCIPAGLRHLVAPFLIPKGFQRGAEYLEPLIRERLEQEAQHGKDWPQKPNDIISWMIDATKDRPRTNLELVKAILMTNFAALHTTTMSFTYVMYELATRPEYVQPLREEIEAVTTEEGWSRDAMRKLRKVDSFIKECLRVSNFSFLAMARIALKDFTFSNGMTLPAGSMIGVPFNAIHTDANNYVDPESFDGFRFEKMRSQEGEDMKHQIMSLSPDYILFGYGRQACPGRFFVANELKAMLAHALLKYDFKMANGRGRPNNWQFGVFMVPDVTAKILFRKRNAA